MTPIERQILKNQLLIIKLIKRPPIAYPEELNTKYLLSPLIKEENCCEMPEEFANVSKPEVKKE